MRKKSSQPTYSRRPSGDQRKSQRLVDYEGEHAGPMHYIVRLAQPDYEDAWLLVYVDGEPALRPLCHVFANSGGELHECAEALWREGAHPRSVLELWWGEDADAETPDRTMTTTICAAVPEAYAVTMTVAAMLRDTETQPPSPC